MAAANTGINIAAPTNTSTQSLAQYGTNLIGQGVAQGNAYGNAASNAYGPLLSQYLTGINQNPLANLYETGGTSDPLLEQYLMAAGIPLSAVQAPGTNPAAGAGAGTPPGTRPNPVAPQAGQAAPNTRTAPATGVNQRVNNTLANANQPGNATAQAGANTGAAQNANLTSQENQPSLALGAQANPNTVSIASNVTSPSNPYGLTQAQQTELNGQLSTYQKQSTSAVSQFMSEMSGRGISEADAGPAAALIQQTYNQMGDQLAAQFAQQAQQTQLAALSNLISGGQSAFQGNQSELSEILRQLQSQQNLGINTNLQGGAAALGQANYQQQQSAQNQANQNSLIGSLLDAGTTLALGL